MNQNKRTLESWEVGITKKLVQIFINERPMYFTFKEFNDLVQDCYEKWFAVKHKYKPSRQSSIQTYMYAVVKNELEDIYRKRTAIRRKLYQRSILLDEPQEEKVIKKDIRIPYQEIEQDIDERNFFKKCLTETEQKIFKLEEAGFNNKEISERLKIPKSTISDIRALIRKKRDEYYKED